MTVDEIATFNDNIVANKNLDVDGHTELDNLNVSGISTFVGITTQESSFFATQVDVSGVSTFRGNIDLDGKL